MYLVLNASGQKSRDYCTDTLYRQVLSVTPTLASRGLRVTWQTKVSPGLGRLLFDDRAQGLLGLLLYDSRVTTLRLLRLSVSQFLILVHDTYLELFTI